MERGMEGERGREGGREEGREEARKWVREGNGGRKGQQE